MKYAAIVALTLRQDLSARGPVLMRLFFYWALMLIFSRLWYAVGPRSGFPPGDLVWYFALTEVVALSVPMLSAQIEDEVKRGDVAYRTARPVSYLWTCFSEGVGGMTVRFLTLSVFGLLGAALCAGGPPSDVRGILVGLPLAYIAALWLVLVQVLVGLSAFWVHESAPLHWVSQKFLFVLGGLMLPLDIYPDWLRDIAMWTPFSALLYGPARLMLEFDVSWALWTLGRLLAWSALLVLLAQFVYRRAMQALEVAGG
ncbi:MAG: ABC transporter permease [Planctomycetota bacterium]|jgi:ABC-2 type transport system permease protein